MAKRSPTKKSCEDASFSGQTPIGNCNTLPRDICRKGNYSFNDRCVNHRCLAQLFGVSNVNGRIETMTQKELRMRKVSTRLARWLTVEMCCAHLECLAKKMASIDSHLFSSYLVTGFESWTRFQDPLLQAMLKHGRFMAVPLQNSKKMPSLLRR